MGWAGVATFIATACFLLYRHPPATWHSGSTLSQPRTEPIPEKPASTRDTEDEGGRTVHRGNPQVTGEEDGSLEETQTTPKTPVPSIPLLEVPSLQLDGNSTSSCTTTEEQPSPHRRIQNGPTTPPAVLVSTATTTGGRPPLQPPTTSNTSLMLPPPPPPRMGPPPVSQKQPNPRAAPLTLTARRYPQRANGGGNSTLGPPPSAAASLRVPQNSRLSSSTLAPTQVTLKPSKKPSQRVILEPGYSPLDWAALTSNPNHKLRGANLPPNLIRVTPSMLKSQNGRKGTDAWTSYQGKVYNISPYLPFHPGGKGELLRGAGKDSANLFFEIHPWVNWDAILGECLVGILVSENEELVENKLDAMD